MFKKAILVIGLMYTAASLAIECPTQVKCAKAGDAKSCKLIGGTQDYWVTPGETNSYGIHYNIDDLIEGDATYKFYAATGGSDHPLNYPTCFYTYSDGRGMAKTIPVLGVPIANQRPNYDGLKETNWILNAVYDATCFSADVKRCPFDEKPVLMIASWGQYENRTVKIKGVTVTVDLGIFTIENAFKYCDKNSKDCAIEVYSTQREVGYQKPSILLGTVVIDKDTLKIKSVTKDKANTDFEFKQAKPFNTVQIVEIKHSV